MRARLRCSALGLGLGLTALAATARSQDAAGVDAAAAQPSREIVVTGSRLRQPLLAGVSAIGRLSSQDLEFQGTMRVEDAINRLPQAFADQTSHVGLNPTGTATVNLRALGPERTLVLIDSKRLMPGDPTGGSVAPDLNFIPEALVDRIEIVTGGASAVYGSDAVAGVVNFVLKKHFSGLLVDVQAGADNHRNQEAQIQSAVTATGYALPPANVTDGYGAEVTLVAGAKFPDGRGNVTIYGGYRYTQPVMNGARDFSACPLGAVGGTLSCFGSTHAPALARFVVLDPATSGFVQDLTLDPGGPGGALRGGRRPTGRSQLHRSGPVLAHRSPPGVPGRLQQSVRCRSAGGRRLLPRRHRGQQQFLSEHL